MFRKKVTALITAAAMLFCYGIPQQTAFAESDETVYFTVGSVSGTAGSSVPVSVEIQTESYIWMMGLTLQYDSSLTPVPADPADPTVPKTEADLRTSRFAKPDRELHSIYLDPERHEIYPSCTKGFRLGTFTLWFEIPADAAVGTEYPLNLKVDVLSKSLMETLSSSVTDGMITVTGQPAVTTTAAPVEAAFDITEDAIDLKLFTSSCSYPIPYTASENLDYIEWSTDNRNIWLDLSGKIDGFNFKDSSVLRGTVTAAAHFLDGTVLTDTVSVYAEDRMTTVITDPAIGTLEIVHLGTLPPAATTTAKATTTTAKAATTTAKATTTTAKAATTTAKAATTTTKTATTTTKAAAATTKAATTTTKAATTTTKAATTTTKTATTTTNTATTTTKAAATTTKTATTTTKAATTTTKATTTTAATTVTTVTTPAQTTEPAPLTGDVDENGKVSLEDVQLALKAYTKQVSGKDTELTDRQYRAANVNGDAKLSVDDVQNILIYYVTNTVAGKHLTWEALLGRQPLPYLRTEADRKRADRKTS